MVNAKAFGLPLGCSVGWSNFLNQIGFLRTGPASEGVAGLLSTEHIEQKKRQRDTVVSPARVTLRPWGTGRRGTGGAGSAAKPPNSREKKLSPPPE